MKKIFTLFCILILANGAFSQLTGSRTIPSANYPTVKIAVDSINLYGVGSGGVTFTILGDHHEWSGIAILSNTSSSNSIKFVWDGNGSKPIITAQSGSGTSYDAIFRIEGTDSVTLDGLVLRDTSLNNTTTLAMEAGVQIGRKSATDGSQNITIKNCIITLQKSVVNTCIGIRSLNSSNTGTVYVGSSSSYNANKHTYQSNSISNVAIGIDYYGNSSITYTDNDLYIRNNSITNFSGGTAVSYGININYIGTAFITGNTITNATGNTGNLCGIFFSNAYAVGTDSISNNTITLNGSQTTQTVYGLLFEFLNNTSSNVLAVIANNIDITMTSATTGTCAGIYANGSFQPFKYIVNNNTISKIQYGSTSATATGSVYGIFTDGFTNTSTGSIKDISSNTIQNITRTQSSNGTGASYSIYNANGGSDTLKIYNNQITNQSLAGTSSQNIIYVTQFSNTRLRLVTNNTINGIERGVAATGTNIAINVTSSLTSGLDSIWNNRISNLTNLGTGAFYGIYSNATNTFSAGQDTLENIYGKSTFYGIYRSFSGNFNSFIKKNYIVLNDSNTTSATYAVYVSNTSSTTSSTEIDSNYFTGTKAATTSGTVYVVYLLTPSAYNNIRGNTFNNIQMGNGSTTATTTLRMIYNTTGNTSVNGYLAITGNTFSNISRVQSAPGTGVMDIIYVTGGNLVHNFSNNIIYNISNPTTSSTTYLIYSSYSSVTNRRINNNTIYNISRSGTATTGTTYGIYGGSISASAIDSTCENTMYNWTNITSGTLYTLYKTTASLHERILNNTIHTISSRGTLYGIHSTASSTNKYIQKNRVYNLSTSGTSSVVYGINISNGAIITNNLVSNINAPNSSTTAVYGMYYGGTTPFYIYNNSIFLNCTQGGANFGSSGLYTSTSPIVDLRNNIIVNRSTSFGTGRTTAYHRSSTLLTSHNDSSGNNIFYAGTQSTRAIHYDGSTSDSSLTQFHAKLRAAGKYLAERHSYESNVTFLDTNGASSDFLKVSPLVASYVESGGQLLLGGNVHDYGANNSRITYPQSATNGGGTSPDIGAWETDATPNASMSLNTVTVTHPTTSPLARGNRNAEMLRINVNTTGSYLPDTLASLSLNSIGTTLASDVDSMKLFFTGASSTFDSLQSIDADTFINGQFKMTTSNLKLREGDNYFWLTYNIDNAATYDDTCDAGLDSISIGNTTSYVGTNPSNYRVIQGPMCGTYTVGASGYFATLTQASQALSIRGVDPACSTGVTLSLIDASYSTNETFPIVFDTIPGSGYGPLSVKIKPAAGVNATITGNLSNNLLIFRGCNYVTLDGSNNGSTSRNLTINNDLSAPTATTAGCVGLVVSNAGNGTNHLTIKNVNFTSSTGAPIQLPLFPTQYCAVYGINTASLTSALVSSPNHDYLTIDNNRFYNIAYGTYLSGGSTANQLDSLVFTDNIIGDDDYITNIGAYGATFFYVDTAYITGNTIYNLINSSPTSWNNPMGIEVNYTSLNGYVNISNNTIYSIRYDRVSSTAYGVVGIYVSPNSTNANLHIYNNIIADLKSTGAPLGSGIVDGIRGIVVAGTSTSNVNIYHNSIYLQGAVNRSGATNDKSAAIHIHTIEDSIFIKNNALYNNIQNSAGIDTAFAIYSSNPSSDITVSNNNDYYVSGTRSMRYFNSSYGSTNTLSGIQSATGQDGSSMIGDPYFNSSTDLRLQGSSPAFLTGAYVAAYANDILGTARNVTNPSIGAFEDSGDFVAPTIDYTAFSNSPNTASYAITGNVTATDNTPGTVPVTTRLYYRKSSNSNSWGGTNTNTTDGWKYVDGTYNGGYFDFTIDHTKLNGGYSSGDQIYYFIVARDGKSSPNVSYSKGTLTTEPSSLDVSSNFPLSGSPDSYVINNPISGYFDVGPGYAFANLTSDTGIFKHINENVVGGNLYIRIRGNLTEDGTHALNSVADTTGTSKVYIYPSDNITDTISGYSAQSLIRLNGADRVIIDGRDTNTNTGRHLLFRNRHATQPTISFSGDSKHDTIRYAEIQGNNATTTSGVIVLGAGTSDGVDSIALMYNVVRDRTDTSTSARPYNLVFSEGLSGAVVNDDINLSGNYFLNYSNSAVIATNLGNGDRWIVNNNHMYYNHATTPNTSQFGIRISSGASAYTIKGNYIGGSAPYCQGTKWNNSSSSASDGWNGIRVQLGSTKSTISGNTIKNIELTNASVGIQFIGIAIISSGTVDIGESGYSNIIGDSTDSTSITLRTSPSAHYGIYSTSTNHINIRYNHIQGTYLSSTASTYYAISETGTSGVDSIEHNTIGGTTGARISINTAGTTNYLVYVNGKSSYISNNTLNSVFAYGTGCIGGIFGNASTNGFVTALNNQLGSTNMNNSLSCYGAVTTSTYAINAGGSNSKVTISNNIINGFHRLNTSSSGPYYMIYSSTTGAGSHVWYSNNLIGDSGNVSNNVTAANSTIYLLYTTGTHDSDRYIGNKIYGFSKTNGSSSTTSYLQYIGGTSSSAIIDSANIIGDSAIDGSISIAGTGTLYGLYSINSSTRGHRVKNNSLGGWTRPTAGGGSTYGLYNSSSSNSVEGNIYANNRIQNFNMSTTSSTLTVISMEGNSATKQFIYNNDIRDIQYTSSGSYAFYGLDLGSGMVYLTQEDEVGYGNNNVGDSTVANDILINTTGIFRGIYMNNGTSVYKRVVGNFVQNVTNTNTGSYTLCGMAFETGGFASHNTVRNLKSSSSSTSLNTYSSGALLGIASGNLTTGNDTLKYNQVYNLSLENTSAVNNNCIGIHYYSFQNIHVSHNRVYNLKNSSTGATASIRGMHIGSTSSTANGYINNNQMFINNHGNTNDVQMFGISENLSNATGFAHFNYNTVWVSGTATGSPETYGYTKTNSAGTGYLVNNAFIVSRKNATNTGSAIHVISLGGTHVSNYNFLATLDSSRATRNATTERTFRTRRNTDYRDSSSWYAQVGVDLNMDSLFTDSANGVLNVNTAYTGAWYLNGKGIAGSGSNSIATDYSGGTRGTTLGFGTDIGSDEFSTSTTPPLATRIGNIANGSISTFMFGGREVASMLWSGTSVPDSVAVIYYTGEAPPDPTNGGSNPSAKYFNAYHRIDGINGTDFEYDIRVVYDPALLGTIPTSSDIKFSKKPVSGTGNWKMHVASEVDSLNKWVYMDELNSFSFITGSEDDNPLPVRYGAFSALPQGKNALINFSTLSESDMISFYVERSLDGRTWTRVQEIEPQGSLSRGAQYQWTDLAIGVQHNLVYYRIKSLDNQGYTQYTLPQAVNFTKPETVQIRVNAQEGVLMITSSAENNTLMPVEVTDLQGRVLIRMSVTPAFGFNSYVIPGWSELAQGIYLIRTTDQEQNMKVFKP